MIAEDLKKTFFLAGSKVKFPNLSDSCCDSWADEDLSDDQTAPVWRWPSLLGPWACLRQPMTVLFIWLLFFLCVRVCVFFLSSWSLKSGLISLPSALSSLFGVVLFLLLLVRPWDEEPCKSFLSIYCHSAPDEPQLFAAGMLHILWPLQTRLVCFLIWRPDSNWYCSCSCVCETKTEYDRGSSQGPRTTVFSTFLALFANSSFICYHNYTVYALFYKIKNCTGQFRYIIFSDFLLSRKYSY